MHDGRLTIPGLSAGGADEIPVSGVQAIEVYGRGGDDVIDASALAIPVRLEGNSGADILIGGGGDDTLVGVVGEDSLHGREGTDTLELRFDLGAFFSGDLRTRTTYADAVGDVVTLTVNTGDALTRAAGKLRDFLSRSLRPVTDFLNTTLVSLPALGVDMKVRNIAREVPVVAQLVAIHDDLLSLDRVLGDLPTTAGWLHLGTFRITPGGVLASSSDPLAPLAGTSTLTLLASRGLQFPMLTDATQLARAAVGGVADLITLDIRLSDFLGGGSLEARHRVAKGVYAVGPVPVQYWVDLFGRLDFAVRAGLDTHGFATGGAERGLFLQDFRLTTTGGIAVGTGWDADDIARSLMNSVAGLTGVRVESGRLSVTGELSLSRSWVLNDAGGKVYLLDIPAFRPALRVEDTLNGRLELNAEFRVRAAGWSEQLLDHANGLVRVTGTTYYEIEEEVLNWLGKVIGTTIRREEKPEWEIEKELTFSRNVELANFSRRLNTDEVL